ncbi:HlyD family secretion protein [Pendulispora brunnea]|uniref:HlyD family secretion protein n=1 Tax=Pendulispora brunnea TaxID=2905690 RepID=A0ABZ2KJ80_9BACT
MSAATSTTEVPSTEAVREALAETAPPRKRRTPRLLAALGTVALVGAGSWYALTAGRENTDDAQVEGRVMNVSARVPGQVLHVRVSDNQTVNAGDVLIELDPADYQAKVDAARADVVAARAQAEGARASLALIEKTAPANVVQAKGGMTAATSSMASAQAAIAEAKADYAAAASRKSLAELNLKRSRALLEQKAVPQLDLDSRQTEFDNASAQLDQARARQLAAEASLASSNGGVVLAKGRLTAADTSMEQVASARAALALAEAKVEQAESARKLAELNLSYTTLRAARRGVVSRRTVEEGQMVSPERPLFAVVPLDDVWVVANFKEDQLAEMRPGQPVTVRLDTYGRRDFQARVDSIAGGTGARFALLPPDNATGNFVKVVQRVPVLVRFDGPLDVELRPGMSADVTVRTRAR